LFDRLHASISIVFVAFAFALTICEILNLPLGVLTKDNYLNQRSKDGGGLGCNQDTFSFKTKFFLREASVNPNNLP